MDHTVAQTWERKACCQGGAHGTGGSTDETSHMLSTRRLAQR